MNTIKYAENWFKLQNIPTIVQNDKIYISNGHFEFELSLLMTNPSYKDEILKEIKEYKQDRQ